MEVIESCKQKARDSVANLLASLEDEDENTQVSVPVGEEGERMTGKQLVEEIAATESGENYEEEQYQYFAGQVKQKQHKCVVCRKPAPKYTCPKCHVRYCSKEHYKTHNLFCTERFYRGEVEALLRRTRAAEGERRKVVEMLRVNREETAEGETEVMQEAAVKEVEERRLEQILAELQDGREVELSQNELKCFERYLKEIESCSLEERPLKTEKVEAGEEEELFEEYVPFWTIEEGLSQYFLLSDSIPVEVFNSSRHKDILNYRQSAAPLLRKELASLSQGISFRKTSIFVVYDLVQVVYISALLFRAYNGEYLDKHNQDFGDTFRDLYREDLARIIAESHPVKLSEAVGQGLPTVMPALKVKMAKLEQDLLEVLRGWMPFIIDDSKKIFENRYLCLETLYLILEVFRSRIVKPSRKKDANYLTKMVKKMEFLLAFTSQIVYASPQSKLNLPPAFIQIDALKLIHQTLSRDGQEESSQAASLKAQRDKQTLEKQLKIQKILIP